MTTEHISLYDIGILDGDWEEEFSSITDLVAEFIGTSVALISFVEPEKDRQFFKAAFGLPEPWLSRRETPLSHSFCQHVRYSGQSLKITDSRTHPLVKDNGAVKDLNVIAYLGVPILGTEGKPVGALCAIEGIPREWSQSDVEMIEKFARIANDQIQLRVALKKAEIQEQKLTKEIQKRLFVEAELTRLASTDPLTGALNRRSFENIAKSELARKRRYSTEAAIVLVDLDHFKAVNDQHGHDAGDAVLKECVARMVQITRKEVDAIARLGGEEFAVLLPETDAAGAKKFSERCRSEISREPFLLPSGQQINVTASIGVTLIEDRSSGADYGVILKQADEALYEAKRAGRNRVIHRICQLAS